MSVCMFNLIMLIFFHMRLDEFSNFFHDENDFFIFDFLHSFSNRIFVKLNEIKTHSWLEIVISEKWEYLCCDWDKSV
jgi:hypothetical protein